MCFFNRPGHLRDDVGARLLRLDAQGLGILQSLPRVLCGALVRLAALEVERLRLGALFRRELREFKLAVLLVLGGAGLDLDELGTDRGLVVATWAESAATSTPPPTLRACLSSGGSVRSTASAMASAFSKSPVRMASARSNGFAASGARLWKARICWRRCSRLSVSSGPFSSLTWYSFGIPL